MTVKQFFKSVTFKCLVTLLCVLLVSGIFLTIMNGLLGVSDEERFNRKVGKLYTDGSSISTELKVDTQTKVGDSTIEKVWFIPEKNDYLVQSYGQGRDGKITVWVIVSTADNKISGLGTVLVYETVDSYINYVPGWNSNISNFSKDYVDGIQFAYGTKGDSMYINTGASISFNAICACVNDSVTYMKTYLSGGPVEKAPYDDFLYNKLINQDATTVEVKDGKIVYNIKTKRYGNAEAFTVEIIVGSNKTIDSFTIIVNGSTEGEDEEIHYKDLMPDVENIFKDKDLSYFTTLYGNEMEYKSVNYDDTSIFAGATSEGDLIASNSTYLCMYAGAFATANFDNVLNMNTKYTDRINMSSTTWTVDGDKVTYTVNTKGYGDAEVFTIEIVVGSDKTIDSFTIKVNGSTKDEHEEKDYKDLMPDVENILKGKDLSYFTALYGEEMKYKGVKSGKDDAEIVTGASADNIAANSTYLCMYAGAFATANYDIALLKGGSTNE